MPRYLAIDWDDHELRAVVATTSGRSVTVERAEAIDLPTSNEGKAPSSEAIGNVLSDWLREQGVSRCATLVSVGRASIELRRFTLPPAPDDELPEMVRFQAQREFSSLTDDSPLDFLPLAGDANTPRQVLAAALSPELLAQIRSVCDTAGLRAERIVLRPCATSAVVRQAMKVEQDADSASLIVDPLPDEVDLSVLVGGKVAFIRTVRLPHVEADERQFRPLMGELRRTIAAFHNQFREVRIASVTVCGDPQQRAALAEAIEGEFDLPTSLVHPLEAVGGTSRFKKHIPEHPGRFAPLVGMILDEAASSHAIDFLNPRKKLEQRTSRLTYVLAAAAVLLMLGWYAWWQYDRISEKRQAVADLNAKIQEANRDYEDRYAPIVERAATFDKWLASDVVILDKLSEVSPRLRRVPLAAENFPESEDAVVTSLSVSSAAEGAIAKLDLAVRSKDRAYEILDILDQLRESGDAVSDTGAIDNVQTRPGYNWTLPEATLHVSPPED